MTTDLKAGDQVYIVGGLYRRYGKGTYLRPYGKKMCTIKVHGDTVNERNVWLSSVQKVVVVDHDSGSSPTATISMTREEYNSLLQDIVSVTKALHELQIKVKGYEK